MLTRNTFVTLLILEGPAFAGDGKERLEGLFVKIPIWVFCRVIRHHSRRERIPRGRDDHSSKLWEKEVGIVGNGVVEACLSKWEQSCVLVGSVLVEVSYACSQDGSGYKSLTMLSGRAS